MWLALFMLLLGVAAGAAVASIFSRRALLRGVERVREAERRARGAERLAELGSMTGGLAHEIKNPLSTIGLNAQLLAESIDDLPIDADTKGRMSRRVASLRREVERLRGILTDFLEFAGELRLERHPANVNEVVRELVDFFLPQAEKQAVRLRMDLTSVEPTASIDVPHVKQALLNLMLNGVQAMSSETSPALRELIVRTAVTRRATQAATETPETLEIHVIDTGPGIPPETLEKIWRPYFTTKSGGTGLGLPTTRRIIEAHGGKIEVHTAPGRGTDFVVHIPLSPAVAAASA